MHVIHDVGVKQVTYNNNNNHFTVFGSEDNLLCYHTSHQCWRKSWSIIVTHIILINGNKDTTLISFE